MSFLTIDLYAKCGEDIALAIDADKRKLFAIENARQLHRRLSNWMVNDDGAHLSTFKKPKRPGRWIVIILLALLFFFILK